MHGLAQLFQNDGNIILMGPPGAGKTSCAKRLASKFGLESFDIDDDLLEKVWKCSVGEKLRDVGDSKFVELEGEALLTLDKKNTVIALTGSNPLHEQSMLYLRPKGIVVYIDVPSEDILNRLEIMKVDRIVGQGTKTLAEILAYRKGFYEKYYDLRVLIPHNASLDQVADLVSQQLEFYITAKQTQSSRFTSTRSQDKDRDFFHVILKGLAEDGGLYMPKSFPRFSDSELCRLSEHIENYSEFALRVLERWIPEIKPQILKTMTEKAYKEFSPLVRQLNDNKYLLELFHGPTASFKDFALQLFPQIFSYIAKESKYCILVSTSGDTGSATVSGFCKQTDIPVMVLFPSEGVSPVQKAQMVTANFARLKVLGVQSDFDYCQSSLKEVFNDNVFTVKLKEEYGVAFSAANSINWGRLLPQVCYHIYSYLHLAKAQKIKIGDPIDLCVPTGNFGNILAGVLAKECGINIRKFVCASNDNNVLSDFIRNGVYDIKERNLVKTDSPSIDILKSSNLERLLYVLDRNCEISKYFKDLDTKKEFKVDDNLFFKLKENFYGSWCDNVTAIKTIRLLYDSTKKTGTPVLIDPHTAVGVHVADEYRQTTADSSVPLIVASTAHYAKFPSAILEALELPGKEDSVQTQINTIGAFVEKEKAQPGVHKDVLAACNSTTTRYAIIQPSMNVLKLTIQDFVNTLVQEKLL